ncbi:MAG TPA: hypothetical protein VGI89_10095 [Rhizomicrobium sp.]|jgi:hypothetical protein
MSNHCFGAVLTIMLAGTGIARADVDAAQVTLAYVDGYTGTDGQFHPWEHRSDAENIRATHADKYRPWRHDDPRHKDDR